jgi:hypothetical protein
VTNIDQLFSHFPDAEMIPIMKRAFDETSETVHAWGSAETVFPGDEAEETIAREILSLAEEGVTGAEALGSLALARFGAAALDKVALDIRRPAARESTEIN